MLRRWHAELRRALDARKDEILALSRDLIAIPSENPPGVHYGACMDRLAAELARLGLAAERLEAPGTAERRRPNLRSFYGEGARTVYFHGHVDVVPAQSAAQFAPRVEGGWLHGRGSADMKAALAAMLYAACVVRDAGVPLAGRIGLCFVGDEETGGQGGSRYLDERGLLGQDGIAMLTPEPTSGVVWNANRGALSLRVTVRGKTAHVGLQHEGRNAFEQMLRVATALQGLKAEVERRRTAYQIVPEAAAHSILMLGGQVAGGANFNVVPGACSFTLDRRFNPEEDLQMEKARLLGLLEGLRRDGIELEVDVLQEGPSAGIPEAHGVSDVLRDAAQEVTGVRPPVGLCPGLLETRWYVRRGVPALAFGPGRLELAHGPDEAVELDRLYEHTLVYALSAARLLAPPEERDARPRA